jgi:hypothetical protein
VLSKVFVNVCLLLCSTLTYAACALSTEPHPVGKIGIQILYPDREEGWMDADDLGVSWIRVELRWDWLQTASNGEFESSYADKVFALAARHPQKILLLLNHAPKWAQSDSNLLPERSATVAKWLINRYGDRIHALEVFNEPNISGFGWPNVWATSSDSAIAYAKTLTAVSSAIRNINRKIFIISAGLSPQENTESFARVIVRNTPTNCMDGFGMHPYHQSGRFAVIQRNAVMLFQQETGQSKPVWFTEFGTDSDADRGAILASLALEKSVAPITIWFNDRDIGRFSDTYGLRKFDGTKKTDFNAFKQLGHRSEANNRSNLR